MRAVHKLRLQQRWHAWLQASIGGQQMSKIEHLHGTLITLLVTLFARNMQQHGMTIKSSKMKKQNHSFPWGAEALEAMNLLLSVVQQKESVKAQILPNQSVPLWFMENSFQK